MKILHVGVGNLGPGGVSTYVSTIVQGQRAQGHDVVLSEIWSPPDTLPSVEEKVGDLGELARLRERISPDVVHAHSQLPAYGSLGQRAVVTAHEHTAHCPSGGRYLQARRRVCTRQPGWFNCLVGHYLDRCGSRSPSNIAWRMKLTREAASFPGHWAAPSSFTCDWLRRRGIPAERVHLIHNPVPSLPEPGPRDGFRRKIVFLGRLVPNKGADILLRALPLVADAELVMLGDGPELDALRSLACALGIEARVRFAGWSSREAVNAELGDTAIVSVPSLWPEPFGLVALEANARGIPVVASAVGGLVDVIEDGVTGLLVPPDDPRSLAEALARLLSDAPLRAAMGAAGIAACRGRFSLEAHLAKLDSLYHTILGVHA